MSDKLKVYYDAEFTGLHRDTSLISIGLVTEYGNSFYAEFTDFDNTQLDGWIVKNVILNLVLDSYKNGESIKHIMKRATTNEGNKDLYNLTVKGSKKVVRKCLSEWLSSVSKFYNKQIQIYCDCYAYDWMLFNDLICEDGKALNLPEYIYYIPVDLSTTLQIKDHDPDVTREVFAGDKAIDELKTITPFMQMGDKCKHNSLWDAYVCKLCFNKLLSD